MTRLTTQDMRILSAEDQEKIERQNCRLVSPFQAKKLEEHAQKYWDQFYNRNKTNFFKDRHWTTREFKELLGEDATKTYQNLSMLEIGCGVGNLIFPLIEEGTDMQIYACDFSPRAVDFVKSHHLYNPSKVNVFQADITTNDLIQNLKDVNINLATMIFVLSAIHPDKFSISIRNLLQVLQPGGLVLFRDYGIHDMTQIRFKPGHKISENFYMRQDGTRSYFFSVALLKHLFVNEGFEVITCSYIESRTVNKKEGVDVPRVFIQAKFRKPLS